MIKEWLKKRFLKSLEGKTLEEVWRIVPTKEMFHPIVQNAIDKDLNVRDGSEFIMYLRQPVNGCFTFPLLSDRYCRFLISEADKNGGWGKNSKDNYTAFELTLMKLRGTIHKYHRDVVCLRLINSVLSGLLAAYRANNVQAAFLIKYEMDTCREMDMHYDEHSLISVSISLNDEYKGGGLNFVREPKNTVKVAMGHACLFAGNPMARHKALPIKSGTRYVLVYWLN